MEGTKKHMSNRDVAKCNHVEMNALVAMELKAVLKELETYVSTHRNVQTVIKEGLKKASELAEHLGQVQSEPPKDDSSKKKTAPAAMNEGKKEKKKKTKSKKQKETIQNERLELPANGQKTSDSDGKWTKVTTKKKMTRPKSASSIKIVVSAINEEGRPQTPGTASYADIVRKLQGKEGELSPASFTARRNGRGELVLRALSPEKGDLLYKLLDKEAGDNFKIKKDVPKSVVLVRDLCEGHTTESVRGALSGAMSLAPELIEVSALRPAYGGTFVCKATVPCSSNVSKIVKMGTVPIGVFRCRIRQYTEVRRCFRCHGFGHVAAKCKGEDRSKNCMRCNGQDHVAAQCREAQYCSACKSAGKNADHRSGSSKCAAFEKALKIARQR